VSTEPAPLSPAMAEAVRAVVREELASMGGHLLRAYGDNPDPKARTLAAVGGYLLQQYGDGDPTEPDEPDTPPDEFGRKETT